MTKYIVDETQTRTFKQHAAAINLRGTPFQTWAGDISSRSAANGAATPAVGGADANTIAGNYIAPQTSALPFTKTTGG